LAPGRFWQLHDVTLVGHSLGAGVALEAANGVDGCRALAMINGALRVELPPPDGKAPGRPLHNLVMTARRAPLHRILRNAPWSIGTAGAGIFRGAPACPTICRTRNRLPVNAEIPP
jgi:pimeloyl-ACP methyl ester carboxylesterase